MTHLSVPSFWRLNRPKYGLVGVVCKKCGKVLFPPRSVCPACGSMDFSERPLSHSGQILTWTTIHVPPAGVEAPYTIAIIRLDDGVVVPGQVVGDLTNLGTNASVRAVFRKTGETEDGLLLYGLKFELAK